MSKKLKLWGLLLLMILLALPAKKCQAKAVNYQALKYGSGQTSMAAGYYAQPAEVKVQGHQYLVMMTIRTKKSLSPWPVKVLTVAGRPPLRVVKTRDAGGYDYRYSFISPNLRGRINSYISINVPGVYRAKHNISFVFKQSQLPKLAAAKQAAVKKPGKAPAATAKTASKTPNSSNQPKKAASRQLALNNQHRLANQKNERNFDYFILTASLLLLVVIVICGLVVYTTYNKVRAKKK
jgi:heme-binding NEAT domain protein